MTEAHPFLEQLSEADRERYEQLASAFDDAWHLHPDQPPDLEPFLPPGEPLRSVVLVELVRIDLELRGKKGLRVQAGDYLDRFPQHQAQLEGLLRRALAEPEQTVPIEDPGPPVLPVVPAGQPSWPNVPGYEILAELGHGSMGVVYKARQRGLDRLVALKMIRAGSGSRPDVLQRFLAEARVVASLRHPNIVQLYEISLQQDNPYFSMELIEGGSLADQLAGRPQPFDESARLVLTLARTLHVAHQRGIVHRDLKPANILLALCEDRVTPTETPVTLSPCHPVTPSGFVPKVTDFGLAKQLHDASQTESGMVLGTPSYMAPEQARGQSHQVGPAADVYALGAILYELLTGRPPLRAESAPETLLLLFHLEPVPPSRLRPKVPRDLETICLKCLHKESRRRYASAAELADDLHWFLEGRPIKARPVGWAERLLRWCRRKPAAAALVATTLLLLGLMLAGGIWLEWQRAERRAEITRREARAREALDQATRLMHQGRWSEALTVLVRAQARLEDMGSAGLRQKLGQVRTDLELAVQQENIRLKRAVLVNGKFDLAGAAREYEEAFARAGLVGDEDELVRRLRDSAIRQELVAALDDWAFVTQDAGERARLLGLARRVDPDPAWRDRFRDLAVWADRAALEQLAEEAPVAQLSPQMLTALGRLLADAGADAVPLLREAQRQRPDDFWLNFELGNVLPRRDEAVGYYQAALARRPQSGAVHSNLGHALHFMGRREEGLKACLRAIELEPRYASAHYNLGQVLRLQGRMEEGLAACRRAIELDPRHAPAHTTIGVIRLIQGRLDEAISIFHHVMDFDPRYFGAPHNLGLALRRQGRLDEAATAFRHSIELNPRYAQSHRYLGEVLLKQGRFAEARHAIQRCLELIPDRDPARTVVKERLESCQRLLALDARLPAILQGTDQPADAEEQRDLARLCQDHKQCYAAAVRFYAVAFAAQPLLAQDLKTQDRYRAACAAVLAGTGQGTDASRLDGDERSRLRNQALDWLREERDARARQLTPPTPAGNQLRGWQREADLAAVREPELLRQLPEEEQKQWQRLWTEVEELLAQ